VVLALRRICNGKPEQLLIYLMPMTAPYLKKMYFTEN
jgi:hypothetical protein